MHSLSVVVLRVLGIFKELAADASSVEVVAEKLEIYLFRFGLLFSSCRLGVDVTEVCGSHYVFCVLALCVRGRMPKPKLEFKLVAFVAGVKAIDLRLARRKTIRLEFLWVVSALRL